MSLVHLANVCSHLQNASLARLGLTSIPHTRMHLSLAVQLQRQGFISTVVLGGPKPPKKLLPPVEPEEPLEPRREAPRRRSAVAALALSSGRMPEPEKVAVTDEYTQSEEPGLGEVPPEEGAMEVMDTAENTQHDDVIPKEEVKEPFPLEELFPAELIKDAEAESIRKRALLITEPVTQANRASRRLWLGLKYWDGEPVLRKMRMHSKPTQRLWLTHPDLCKIVRGSRANYVDGLTRIGECLFLSTDKGVMEARECVERKIGGLVLCRVYG